MLGMSSTLSAAMPYMVVYSLRKIFSLLGMFLLHRALRIAYTSPAFHMQIRYVLTSYT
jgi:hypothetical protein